MQGVADFHPHPHYNDPARFQHEPRPRRKYRIKRRETYASYIYKILHQVHPQLGISLRAMKVMNSFACDMFERMAREAGQMARYKRCSTLSALEIQTAIRLIFPDELAKHAISQGTKALEKYASNK